MAKKRVVLDAVGVPEFGGGDHVLRRILDACSACREDVDFVVMTHDTGREWPSWVEVVSVPWTRTYTGRVGWVLGGLSEGVRQVSGDLVWLLNGLGVVNGVSTVALVQQGLWFEKEALWPSSMQRQLCVTGPLAAWSCQRAKEVLVQSDWVRQRVLQVWGIEAQNVSSWVPDARVLPVGPVRSGAFTLLYVGHDLEYKQVPLLCEAVARCRARGVPVVLEMTLRGRDRDGVRYLGRLSSRGVHEAMRRADVVVSASLCETVGLPMLEALAAGVPVVAPDLDYVRAVTASASLVRPPQSVVAWADVLCELLGDVERREVMAKAGLEESAARAAQEPYLQMVQRVLGHLE